MKPSWTRPRGHALLMRRTRWRVALRGALLVTAVLAALSGGAYAAARGIVFAQLHERLEHAAAEPERPDADAYAWVGTPPGSGGDADGDGFYVWPDPVLGAVAFLRSAGPGGGTRWLATPAQDDMRALRAFLGILIGLTAASGLVAMPVGYLLAGEALRPLDEAVRTRTEFVALASHRLRTPLSVIRTSADLALSGSGVEPQEALRTIVRQGEQLEALAARLSALARAEIAPGLKGRETDLAAAVQAAVSALRASADGQGVRLDLAPSAPVRIAGAPDDISDVLASVLENAVRFTPTGGSVDVRVAAEGRSGTVEVHDTGPGIDPADLPNVLRPFFQGRRAHGGFGLGLAIARAAAERAGGRLEIASPREGGTTVRVRWRTVARPPH